MNYDRVILELLDRINILEKKISFLEKNMHATSKYNEIDLSCIETQTSDFSIRKNISNIIDTQRSTQIKGTGKKYRFLSDYLIKNGQDRIKLSFNEIEKLLCFRLPKSALVHRAFWSNTTTHSIALSWLNVGYETVEIDLDNEYIIFEKQRRY